MIFAEKSPPLRLAVASLGTIGLAVARRVPVRIAFRMDERKIPDFLAACANSPFAFEVWQTRINRHKPGEGIAFKGGSAATRADESQDRKGGDLAAGMAGGGGGAGAALEGGEGGDEQGGSSAGGGALEPVEIRKNYDVNVEFYGVVKIYNPVNQKLLKGEQDAAPSTQP